MTNVDVAREIGVTNKMMTGVDMFRPGMIDVVLNVLECSVGRVCEDERGLLLWNIDRGEEIAEEHSDFSGGFSQSKIFSFHARESDSVGLFVRFPDDGSTVVVEDDPRSGTAVVRVGGAGGVGISMERCKREVFEVSE